MQCPYCGEQIPIVKNCPYCEGQIDIKQARAIQIDLLKKMDKMIHNNYKYQDQFNDTQLTDDFIMSNRKGRPSPFHPF